MNQRARYIRPGFNSADSKAMSIDDFSMSMSMDFGGHGMDVQGWDGSQMSLDQGALDPSLDMSQPQWNVMHGR